MHKVISLGKVAYTSRSRKVNEVTIEITLEDGALSMQGSIWNARHFDIEAVGQIYDEIAALFPNDAKVQRMVEVWRRWHLNDMRAGCEHQRAAGWDERPIQDSLRQLCPVCGYKYGTAWLREELPAEIIREVESW